MKIREHITTLALATPHPSLSSASGHQGDEWLSLVGNSPAGVRGSREKKEMAMSNPHSPFNERRPPERRGGVKRRGGR